MDAGTLLSDTVAALPIGGLLWVVAIVATALFIIHAVILSWHWREYSTGSYTSAANLLMYLCVGGCFIALMFLSTLWYSLS